jgi:phosphatidate cytidylyltransferase
MTTNGDSRDTAAAGGAGERPSGFGARVGSDLKTRVVSGVVLVGGLLALTIMGDLPFAMLLTLVGGVVAWEWGRIVRGADMDVATAAHAGTVVAAVVLTAMGQPFLGLLAVAIGMVLVGLLSFGRSAILSATGVAYAGLPVISLVWLRADSPHGLKAVLFIILTVAVVDTAAYFSGRLMGGPKLWAAVSPNKTWAGFGGAVVGGAVAGLITAWLVASTDVPALGFTGAVLAVVAQAGDLAESALKRAFGAKDASALIPGHGGAMDRVDGIIAASIAAAVWGAWINVHHPAGALLLVR